MLYVLLPSLKPICRMPAQKCKVQTTLHPFYFNLLIIMLKKLLFVHLSVSLLIMCSANAEVKSYTPPPTSSTFGFRPPVISDEQMKKCVELYNQAKWLGEELDAMTVDMYSQTSVDQYNQKARAFNNLTNQFNHNCAGKQSESACKEANRLNREQGLPEVSCTVTVYP